MTKNDPNYKEMGFKCGLEIHQQLETHNLFCECPSIVHDENPSLIAMRKLRAVVGETGEIDAAAAHEQAKSKIMQYEGCEKSYCLVELDEEPPRPINQEAVHIAVQMCKMLNMEMVDEIHVMRKTVVDGSNVSGFQRTALVGMNGYIETSKGNVRVNSVCLEEEASKKVEAKKDSVIYRLDRLGVCLLEIATEPDIKDPEHAKECAEILGMMLRSTSKVKRGIGTIRQDVNVSIKGGERVEIKGFQDLKSIPKVVTYEIKRQKDAIEKKETLVKEVRKAESDFTTSFLRPMPGAARMYPETDVLPLRIDSSFIDSVEVPELLSDKKEKLSKKYGLDAGIIDKLIKRNIDLGAWVKEFSSLKPVFIASSATATVTELERKEKVTVTNELVHEVLSLVNTETIPKDAFGEVLTKKAKGEKINLDDYKGVDDSVLEKEIKGIIDAKPGLNMGGYMGLVMKHFQGKVDGKKASQILGKLLK